jgi:hypothetical protein
MEKHNLTIIRNNYEEIKKGMIYKFQNVENFVRFKRESIKARFCLPEDYLPKVEPQRKKKF